MRQRLYSSGWSRVQREKEEHPRERGREKNYDFR